MQRCRVSNTFAYRHRFALQFLQVAIPKRFYVLDIILLFIDDSEIDARFARAAISPRQLFT